MKIRTNYVSNSSSCSWIVKKDLSEFGIGCIKLTIEQLNLIKGYPDWDNNMFDFDENKEYWLTEFISDCYEHKYEVAKDNSVFHYDEGGHYGPYDEDCYNEYTADDGSSVWIRKEHDVAKEMTINKFANSIKKEYGNCNVLVEYISSKEIKITLK